MIKHRRGSERTQHAGRIGRSLYPDLYPKTLTIALTKRYSTKLEIRLYSRESHVDNQFRLDLSVRATPQLAITAWVDLNLPNFTAEAEVETGTIIRCIRSGLSINILCNYDDAIQTLSGGY